MSSIVIGIDLGTTNSCFGYVKNGRVELIVDETGSLLIPSVVTFNNEKRILTGASAVGVAPQYKLETIYEAKRLIGQSFDNPKVQEDISRFPYVVKNDFGTPKIVIKNDIWDKELYVEEISHYILKHIVDIAKTRLRITVSEAVITIPAYFGNDQRNATKDAANLAGIETAHIINEPTAAALAFQHSNKSKFERNLLIFDFGGGTFDVCVVRAKGNHCKVLAVDGDCHLGGTDVDMNVINFIRRDILDKHGKGYEDEDWKIFRRLKNIAEDAKKYLSTNYKYTIELASIYHVIDYQLELTRQQFEKLNTNIFDRTMEITEKCVSAAKLNNTEIDQVVLVGGSSRIPKIRDMLKSIFGDKINVTENPDHLVASGAAVFASTLGGDKSEMTFEDVLTLSLGTDVRGNQMSTIIERNTPLPCERRKRYVTTYDNQAEMSVKIYQGERVLASQNTLLGDMAITNLTEAPLGRVTVEIKLSVNTEGILTVTAQEGNTDNVKTLDIDMRDARMSTNDIQRRLKEAEAARLSDESHVLLTRKKLEFEEFSTNLEEMASEIDDGRSNDILREVDSARQSVKSFTSSQIDEIDDIKDRLIQMFNPA